MGAPERSDEARMVVETPAKINLHLSVKCRRPDGYHELTSVMCPISLFDRITLSIGGQGVRISCDHSGVPADQANLAWRAADLFFQQTGKPPGLDIHIEKRIPVAGGLGGGSSNAAAVLSALNRHFGNPLTTETLLDLGLRIGADVPFFILGQTALATGIGEMLEPYAGVWPYHLLLTGFPFHVSTAWVYAHLNLGLTKCGKINNSHPFKDKGFSLNAHLINDLEAVTVAAYPVILDAKRALMDARALAAMMSGSGPTVFGLFEDSEMRDRAFESLSKDCRWRVFKARIIA